MTVASCGAPVAPSSRGDATAANPATASGFPLGSFAKEVQDPELGRIRLAWTFEEDGRWAEVPFALEGQSLNVPAMRGTYTVEGDTVTLATEFPPGWGTSQHTWRLDGDRLWTSFVSSTNPDDADWFKTLDDRPWVSISSMSRRVLVVDDHAGFRTMARRLLEADGWDVVGEAWDGASAVAATAALRPDVVLIDIGLPGVDGFIVADRVAMMGSPDIVLVSSRDPDTYADRIASSVAVGFIAKVDLDGDRLRVILGSASR